MTLVVAFVPLVCGIYRAGHDTGAIFSILLGVPVWLGTEYIYSEESEQIWRNVPSHLYGLMASFTGMWIGSSMPGGSSTVWPILLLWQIDAVQRWGTDRFAVAAKCDCSCGEEARSAARSVQGIFVGESRPVW